MAQTPSLSVVIPTRNRHTVLLRCIHSIVNSSVLPGEIIVVDDYSDDATKNLTDRNQDGIDIRIIRLSQHVMMAAARNVGAKTARGELVLFIDDDNVLDPNMIALLIQAAENHPAYGTLGPVMYTLSTRQVQTAFQRISLTTGYTWGPRAIPVKPLVASDGIPNVLMIRQAVFRQCGYFDQALMATYSEIDLDLRARRAGFKCGIVTAAKTYHDNHPHRQLIPRTMGGGTFTQKSYCMIRNRSVMVRRYGAWWQQVLFLIIWSWVWPLLYSAIMARHRRFDLVRWYWQGWRDGLIYLTTGRLINSYSNV